MKVKVCASSANLGPGFDCFGLAWQLCNTIEFLPGKTGLKIEGCDPRFRNASNLAYVAFKAVLDEAGVKGSPLIIRFLDSPIPVSRGLGSSAALIVGGALAANEMYKLGFSKEKLLKIATAIEGHPDNIAPALFGGLTVSTMDGDNIITAPFALSDKLYFTALVPDFELSTELSRSVLPSSISRQDAIFNISRAALLLKGLELGQEELIHACLQDKLHQPFRTKLINGYFLAESLAYGQGAAGVCISGAGSTMLCISTRSDFSHLMAEAAAEALPGWQVLPLLPDKEGAKIIS